MIDAKMMLAIEKIERRLKEIETVVRDLDRAIEGYLQWMADSGYAKSTRKAYARGLNQFSVFIKHRKCTFDAIFTEDTLKQFRKTGKSYQRHAVYGLSRYLFDQTKISRPLSAKYAVVKLPTIYEDYLAYYQQMESWTDGNTRQNRRVLCAFHDYLQKEQIDLNRLVIEHGVSPHWQRYHVGSGDNRSIKWRLKGMYVRGSGKADRTITKIRE